MISLRKNERKFDMKKIKLILFFTFIFLLSANNSIFANNSPVGKWKTIDDNTKKASSHVEIYEKNGIYYAKIIKLISKPKGSLCVKCKGDRYNKPMLGLVFMWGMKKVGDTYKGGKILDPENGKTYTCKMWVEKNRLKVRGYILFFFRTQYWYRIKEK